MAAQRSASTGGGGIEPYRFGNWTRFPFNKADFRWGGKAWVYTAGVPMKNVIILMRTRSGG